MLIFFSFFIYIKLTIVMSHKPTHVTRGTSVYFDKY